MMFKSNTKCILLTLHLHTIRAEYCLHQSKYLMQPYPYMYMYVYSNFKLLLFTNRPRIESQILPRLAPEPIIDDLERRSRRIILLFLPHRGCDTLKGFCSIADTVMSDTAWTSHQQADTAREDGLVFYSDVSTVHLFSGESESETGRRA